jgi:HD-like signal output (HDOD) protein
VILDLSRQQEIELTQEQVHQLESKYCQQTTELVVTRWKMPAQVIESVKPYDSLETSFAASKTAAIVNVASHLSDYMLDIAADDNKETLTHLPALGVLNLYQDSVEKLLKLEETIQQRLDGLKS